MSFCNQRERLSKVTVVCTTEDNVSCGNGLQVAAFFKVWSGDLGVGILTAAEMKFLLMESETNRQRRRNG
jgi:hypothetical protein